MQVGGQFADIDGLEKSSSDGLAKDVLIWQHSAFILLSPSQGNPMSISGTSRKGIHRKQRAQKEKHVDETRRSLRN